MNWLGNHLRRAWHDEGGVASLEFVMAVPLLFAIFSASFESGLLMTRSIMLEQSLDIVMRELRLGHYTTPDSDTIKAEICNRTVILADCAASLTIEFQRVSTTTWTLPTTAPDCVDREEDINPNVALQVGQQNDLMLVRVCIVQDAMFPTTGMGLALTRTESGGGYEIFAISAFSNEPS